MEKGKGLLGQDTSLWCKTNGVRNRPSLVAQANKGIKSGREKGVVRPRIKIEKEGIEMGRHAGGGVVGPGPEREAGRKVEQGANRGKRSLRARSGSLGRCADDGG